MGPHQGAIVADSVTRARIGGIMAVAALAAAGIVLFGGDGAPAPPVPPVAGPALPSSRVPLLTVHVAGAVAAPGLVAVPDGARVADAIAAAGGTTRSADLGALNLAAAVGDGDRVIVPTIDAGGPSSGAPGGGDGKVALNAASVDELEGLPGVGPVLAARIVEYRTAHGPFSTVEDLLDVPGIGEAKLATLRDSVVVR